MRGPEPTLFPITFTTSLFKTDEPGSTDDTGYHVALQKPPIAGSTARYDNIYGKFDLKITIDLQLSEVVLEIARIEKMSVEILVFVIMNTLVSITGIYEIAMKSVERYRSKRKEWVKAKILAEKESDSDNIQNILN